MNKNKGSFLLQINIMLMILCIILGCIYENYIQIIINAKKINSDIEMYRVSRMIFAQLEKTIAYDTKLLEIRNNDWGNVLVSHSISGQKQVTFYCRKGPKTQDAMFYQKIQVLGRRGGINPLSSPIVTMDRFSLKKVDNRTLVVSLEIHCKKDLRRRKFVEVVKLCNGSIS